MKQRALLLDRDGTIIVDKDYLSDPALVELIPGVATCLKAFQDAGWKLVVVTNQSGVGRGKFTEADAVAVNQKTSDLLAAEGVQIEEWLADYAHPDDKSTTRKPAPGLLIGNPNIQFDQSVVIGDKASDLGLGKALGARTCLVRTGYGAASEKQAEIQADFVIDSLADLASVIPPDENHTASLVQRREDHFAQIKRIVDGFVSNCGDDISAAAHLLAHAFSNGNKLLLCGNGGSAADAQHLATEFVARLSADRERRALPAIALTTDTSLITAYTNDYDFDGVYDRQVQALGVAGDILFAISTSGNSQSIVRAAKRAKAQNMFVVGFTGKNDSALSAVADICIQVPCARTMRVQECHLMAYHIIADLVEEILFGDE